MKKDIALIIGLALFIVFLIIFGRGFTSLSQVGPVGQVQQPSQRDTVDVKIKALTVSAKVLDSASERKTGLSGKDSLPLGEAMLFVFEKEGPYGIWMKDMKFAIDIIWIDANKKIVDIAENVAPEPGKNDQELTVYKPKGNALYVIEVNAGLSALHDLNASDTVDFTL